MLPALLVLGLDGPVLLIFLFCSCFSLAKRLLPVGSMHERLLVLRSKAAAKEQIEGLGYSIKVYRTGELSIMLVSF